MALGLTRFQEPGAIRSILRVSSAKEGAKIGKQEESWNEWRSKAEGIRSQTVGVYVSATVAGHYDVEAYPYELR